MSGFWAGAIPPWGLVVVGALLLLVPVCWRLGVLRGREQGYDAAEKDRAEEDAEWLEHEQARRAAQLQARQAAFVAHERRPERHWHGSDWACDGMCDPPPWEPVHVGQALALIRPDLTDSAYTQDMGDRMDRFLAGLCGVPYSADELWSGQRTQEQRYPQGLPIRIPASNLKVWRIVQMRIGAVTHEGYTIRVHLGSQDVEQLVLRMQDHEAGQLVSSLLCMLASIDPLRWDEVHKTVRDIMRAPNLSIR